MSKPTHALKYGFLFAASMALLGTLIARPALAQSTVTTSIGPNEYLNLIPIAVPLPQVADGVDPQLISTSFFEVLGRDINQSDVFLQKPIPAGFARTPEAAKQIGALYLLKLVVATDASGFVIEARLVGTDGVQALGRKYSGTANALPRVAHLIVSEMVRTVSGRPGIFLSQIAYASNRDGVWEIYLMDWDGANQRRITTHKSLSILPSWSPDNQRMVYTSWARGTSDMYIINRRGGGRVRLQTNLALNTSATFSPIGNDIAFVGSVNGNPDIYLIRDDGTNLRRLTNQNSIESTPEWSPNGRQISFTSGRGGTPQIYVMDAEGTDVRRISFDGDWNDDATWSPDGDKIAYTSRVRGRFQIRIANVTTGENRIVAGDGSNEQPTWSPDGKWIAFQSNRSGRWQIYRMRVDRTDAPQQLTFTGENKEPDWSKKSE